MPPWHICLCVLGADARRDEVPRIAFPWHAQLMRRLFPLRVKARSLKQLALHTPITIRKFREVSFDSELEPAILIGAGDAVRSHA